MHIPPDAIIAKEKLTHYLLVFRNEDDISAFLAQAGFTSENPEVLEEAIRQHMALIEAVQDRVNEYGAYYRVEGDLIGSENRILSVVTIWLQQNSEFRFITLKPWRR